MKIELEVDGLDVDAWLHDYLHTTVVFAIWHHEGAVERVRVRLHRASEEVRCALRAVLSGGRVATARATAESSFEALHEACDRLEVALYRSGRPDAPDAAEPSGQLAA